MECRRREPERSRFGLPGIPGRGDGRGRAPRSRRNRRVIPAASIWDPCLLVVMPGLVPLLSGLYQRHRLRTHGKTAAHIVAPDLPAPAQAGDPGPSLGPGGSFSSRACPPPAAAVARVRDGPRLGGRGDGGGGSVIGSGQRPRVLDFADRAHGLDSTAFRRVPPDRDSDRRPASCPSYRHARTCSGHPCGRAAEAVEGDARNKSGHDGGRAFRHGGKRGDRRRCARPKPPLGFARWLNRTAVEQVRA